MPVKFNPFTGQLQIDEKGSGGGSSYIDGEVAAYGDLSLDVGVAPLNSAWLVREASGTWLLGRKPAGIYIRTATAGSSRDADYTYAGILPDVFSDANFTLYDDGDSTKNAKFQLGGIATATTRTITVPNKNVTLDDASDSRTPTAHASSHAAGVKAYFFGQTVGMTEDVFIRANNVGTTGNITLTFNGSTTINSAISTWNSANPSNQVTLVSGTGSQTPNNGESIELESGVNAGSDPYQSVSATILTVVGNSDTTPVAVIQGAQWFGSVNGNQGVLYQGDEDGKVKVIALNKAFNAYRSLELVSDGSSFGFPANGGTLALTSDIPALGTGAGEAAEGNHVHGNLTNDGKVGIDSGRVLVTTTAGAVTTLALGTANQVLRVNSGATGVEFADPAASGVTGAAASASDVLGVSGSNITGVDANADRIVYWNNTSNKLAYGTPADAGAAAASHTHAASDITSGTIDTARLASGTANSGTFLRGDQTWAAAGGVTTGSVDNAIIRADGTGGSTSQSSDLNIEDATTTTANNVTISNQHSGQTNSSLVLSPKGTGAFIVGPKPDGTTTGGNARGARAVDLQWEPRFAATMVASGQASAILNGLNNTASGTYAVAWGQSCTASGGRSTAGGFTAVASGIYSGFAIGWNVTASGSYGASAIGAASVADRQGMLAFASGRPWSSNAGVAQNLTHVLWGKTTTNAAVELLAGDWNEGTVRLTVPSGRVMTGLLTIVGTRSDGSTVASYMRQVTIKNVGGTTSLVGTVNTVGTDEAGGTVISITANDTNDALKVEATGVASQIFRWVCTANMTEMTYGT